MMTHLILQISPAYIDCADIRAFWLRPWAGWQSIRKDQSQTTIIEQTASALGFNILVLGQNRCLLVPDASVLGSDKWPAPSAQVWAAVARLLSNGIHSLHPTAKLGLLVGGLVGVAIPVLELAMPKRKKYIPSAMGLGLAMVIPFWNSLSMFIGGAIALIMEKNWKTVAEKYIIPVSSGVIAGESIIGIVIALLMSTGLLK